MTAPIRSRRAFAGASSPGEPLDTHDPPGTNKLPGGSPSQSEELSPALRARVDRYRQSATAANTSRTYAAQVRQFEHWCRCHELPCQMPIAPVLIAAWLAERADQGASRSTISVALAALKSAHRDAGHRFDGNDAILCSTLRGIRRTLIAPARQVAALSSAPLTELLLAAGPTDLDMRDAAMLSCLYLFALRRSELAGLDFEIAGSGTGVISLTPATIELQLYRSKSSQTEPRRLSVPMSTSPLAVAAIERWVARARISEQEPLMRRILGHERIGGRLTGGGIAIAVKAAVERHLLAKGLPAEVAKAVSKTFAGHSGRLGFVTSSHEAGATELAIAAVTRHKDTTLVNRYARQADQKRTSPHQLPGVGV